MGYETVTGAQDPTGFWDPCGMLVSLLRSSFRCMLIYYYCIGLTNTLDQAGFDYYRAAELKHGRVCMLAIVGYVVPEFLRFPGEIAPGIKFADIPNGVAAINAVPALGWLQMFFLIGFVDFSLSRGKSAFPFAYNVNTIVDGEIAEKRLAQEITHGRLAMIAILETLRHDSQNFVFGGDFDGLGTNLLPGLPFLYPQ